MGNYKTPGVYIEEVSTLPASIAPVATAVPAFIGYTQKAKDSSGQSLLFKAKRISSLVEYQDYFGYGPDPSIDEISMSGYQVSHVNVSVPYNLYYSLVTYFANGGGDCWIVCVGTYGDLVIASDFLAGLDLIKKEDEPTLLLAPDLVLVGNSDDIAVVQQQMLSQAASLQDRFAVLDILENENPGDEFIADSVVNFRDKIGINNLKYGAAYGPYIGIKVPIVSNFGVIDSALSGTLNLAAATGDSDIAAMITTTRDLYNDLTVLDETFNATGTGFYDLVDAEGIVPGTVERVLELQWDYLATELETASTDADIETALRNALKWLYFLYGTLTTLEAGFSNAGNVTAVTTMIGIVTSKLEDVLEIDRLAEKYEADTGWPTAWTFAYQNEPDAPTTVFDTEYFGAAPWSITVPAIPLTGAADTDEIRDDAEMPFENAFASFSLNLSNLRSSMSQSAATADAELLKVFPVYKGIYDAVSKAVLSLPPSGAVVGQYCTVDRTRGVWKAPANVSLNAVAELSTDIDDNEQANLNVDVTAGKSINIIRTFTGKGKLIWGARTLAGNDNEWRYVPVRRFFNFAEESIKKATEFVVFEPNDANTWVRTKAMISNFLTTQWRDGALAGAKPDQAFYVKCGLGETMTAQDILEGRMIVEIGMAVVRPAEFIILRFMHKLQES